jgi:hypothetical protein
MNSMMLSSPVSDYMRPTESYVKLCGAFNEGGDIAGIKSLGKPTATDAIRHPESLTK